MLTRPRGTTHLIVGLLMLVVMSTAAAAQEPKSAALAKELTTLLDGAKLTAIAARDASDSESFVAAMYFSGSQLLIVSAKYTPAVLLNEKLAKKDYQEIYIDLNSASVASTRVFVEDLGADGLKADHEEGTAFDSIDRGGKRTVFDTAWRKDQKLTDEQYAKLFSDADALYCASAPGADQPGEEVAAALTTVQPASSQCEQRREIRGQRGLEGTREARSRGIRHGEPRCVQREPLRGRSRQWRGPGREPVHAVEENGRADRPQVRADLVVPPRFRVRVNHGHGRAVAFPAFAHDVARGGLPSPALTGQGRPDLAPPCRVEGRLDAPFAR